MSGSDWRDARVRQAEESLADAVRTADEIIAAAVDERAEKPQPQVERPDDPPERSILHDAW
ncbi:hypothetical protein BLA60_40225 [Actinophytocola xinjiangensis]|uniref:Uncharacterized protein n=1 Tax=Actinophytocola xinjiangensis TaxID=485602 RepID=A0A7Z1AT82_9PSEU|nr:hypothetical protein [Actinophytocola xinjiangensis]OLF04520.1 hypothetical protein BLA60_40225 [Actinophytocola xinjiangensis]